VSDIKRPFNRGVCMKGNKLLIFSNFGVEWIELWPCPAAGVKTHEKPWQRFRPEIDLNLTSLIRSMERMAKECWEKYPVYQDGRQPFLPNIPLPVHIWKYEKKKRELKIYKDAIDVIPPHIKDIAACFPDRHFSALSFFARCPGGIDHSTPAIVRMLSEGRIFFRPNTTQPLRTARSLLKKRQREQLARLGFAIPSEAAVRVLRKVPPSQCTVEMLFYLRDSLADGGKLKMLSHVKRINRSCVRVVSDNYLFRLATHELLEEIGSMYFDEEWYFAAHQLLNFLELCNDAGDHPYKRKFKSVSQILDQNDELIKKIERLSLTGINGITFPDPPLPGTEVIFPICNTTDLIREGREQHHCIARYARSIAQGNCYAYSIRQPEERATLLIRHAGIVNAVVHWDIEDCRAKANAPILASTKLFIEDWLGQHRSQMPPFRNHRIRIREGHATDWRTIDAEDDNITRGLSEEAFDDVPF
jgi:hypothetical protein